MQVQIVAFPETRVAVVEHLGPPETEVHSIRKLIDWRIANRLPPSPDHRSYGLHYNDPRAVAPEAYRVDLCVSVPEAVADNPFGVVNKVIPACRCARARHLGSRDSVAAAAYLAEQWLPGSGERYSGQPLIFHYVNVGPDIAEQDMITDVYMPLA